MPRKEKKVSLSKWVEYVLREVKLLENGNLLMQKHCASSVKQWEMTPTSTMPEMNSGASMKITTLPFTEEQRRKRTKTGQKSQSKKVPPMWKINSTCIDQKLEAHITLSRDQSISPVMMRCVSKPTIRTCPVSTPLYTNIQAQPKSICTLDTKFKPKPNHTLRKLLTQPLTKHCVFTQVNTQKSC